MGTTPWNPRLSLRVEAHGAVFLAVVVEQGHLVNARFEQRSPVLAQPALGVSLTGEDRVLQASAVDHRAVRLLVPPGPGHPAVPFSRSVSVLRHGRLAPGSAL